MVQILKKIDCFIEIGNTKIYEISFLLKNIEKMSKYAEQVLNILKNVETIHPMLNLFKNR